MEPAWSSVDFTVDISESCERNQAAIAAYASVVHRDRRGWSNGTQQRTSNTAVSWASAMRNPSRARRATQRYLGFGIVILPFFIIAARMAAIPLLTKSVTSEACCCSAATVSASDDV